MATLDTIAGLPEGLLLELEASARAQGRLLGDLPSEAVRSHLHDSSWQNPIATGRPGSLRKLGASDTWRSFLSNSTKALEDVESSQQGNWLCDHLGKAGKAK